MVCVVLLGCPWLDPVCPCRRALDDWIGPDLGSVLAAVSLLIALAFWWFETALNKRSVQALPYVALLLVLGILIGLFQIMPLPDVLADIFVGRQAELYAKFAERVFPKQAKRLPPAQESHSILTEPGSTFVCSSWHWQACYELSIFSSTARFGRLHVSIDDQWRGDFVVRTDAKFSSDGRSIYWTIPLEFGGSPFGPYVNKNNAGGYLLICLACSIGLMYLVMSNRKNRGPLPIISKDMPFWRQLSYQFLYFVSELTARNWRR